VRLWSMAPAGNLLPPRWMLRSRALPPGYYLDRSDTEVLVLRRSPEGAVVARFSARGYLAESIEREAWEDHGWRNGGAASPYSIPGREGPYKSSRMALVSLSCPSPEGCRVRLAARARMSSPGRSLTSSSRKRRTWG
jgi:hypothetical protein